MNTSSDYRPSKYVAKWLDEYSGKWFRVDWLDLHEIRDRQVEIVRRKFNNSFSKQGINSHVPEAMGSRVKFVKCLIVNRKTRKPVFRSK